MLTEEQSKRWEEYLQQEKIKLRIRLKQALENFILSVEKTPMDSISEWVLSLCRRVVDEKEDIPIRFPLFQRVLFPVLLAGYRSKLPGCARWLAGFETLLVQSPEFRIQLGDDHFGAYSLLQNALIHDPADEAARIQLIKRTAYEFMISIHEVPSGVLYDRYAGATSEQCLELEAELDEFHQLVKEAGVEENYLDLIKICRTYYSTYRDYLLTRPKFNSYKDYLDDHGVPYSCTPCFYYD